MTRSMRRRAVLGGLCTGLVALLATPSARAWGGYGHAMIADIAQARLDAVALADVRHLLALDGEQGLDQVASWPDQIGHVPEDKGGLPQTLKWHYVDIDVSHPTYDAARDCPENNCVVARLPEMIGVLGDQNAPVAKRLVALKWVVHLVGDIHQPLHASERDHDKGGNAVKISYYGNDHGGRENLHSLWDEGVIDREDDLHVGPHYSIDFDRARKAAEALEPLITPQEAALWSQGVTAGDDAAAVETWANESHALSIRVSYGALPASSGGDGRPDLGDAYTAIAWPVIQQRLEQAGVRLAAVLNANLTQPIAMRLR